MAPADAAPGSRRPEPIARAAVVAVVLGTALHGILSARSLFADGTYFFWTALHDSGIFWYLSRVSTHALTQTPLALGILGGVDDITALARLQSLGMIGLPLGLWALALVLLRRSPLFWPMAATFAMVYLTTGFMAVGEFHLPFAAVAASAALLLRNEPLTRAARVGVVLLAAVLPFSHETVVFLAPLLAGILLLRARRDARAGRPSPRAWLVVTLVVDALGTSVSAWYILVPRDPGNLSGAADLAGVLATDGQLRLTLAAGLALVAAVTLGGPRVRIGGAVVGVLAAAALLVFPGEWATPGMHYGARTLAGMALFVALALMAVAGLRPPRASRDRLPVWIGPALFVTASAVPLAMLTAGFPGWLGHYDEVVSRPGGAVTLEDSGLADGPDARYGWAWTHPFLSRVLTGDGEVLVLGEGHAVGGWVPEPIPERYDTATPIFPAP
jgi:hypothetical protein